MGGRIISLVLAILMLVAAGCGDETRPDLGSSDVPQGPYPQIRFDSSVSSDDQESIQVDMELVGRLYGLAENSEDARKLGVADFSSNSVSSWLSERAKIIVGESFDEAAHVSLPRDTTTSRPVAFSDRSWSPFSATTVMVNLGAAIYLSARDKNQLASVDVAGQSLTVRSPRVGILAMGSGLFGALTIPGVPKLSIGNVLLRVATYFHESRHTDGNGENTGFRHVECSGGGELGGLFACDGHSNGAYAIEAILLTKFYQACTSCSSTEWEGLRVSIADNASRVELNATFADATPESL